MASSNAAARGSIELELGGLVGEDGSATVIPEINVATSYNHEEVAPWLDGPSPPASPPSPEAPTTGKLRALGFPQKLSFNSLRQNSYPNHPPSHSNRANHRSRPSESHTTSSRSSEFDPYFQTIEYRVSEDSTTSHPNSLSPLINGTQQPQRELRKAKSSLFPMFRGLRNPNKKGKPTRSRATSNADEEQHPSLRPHIPPLPDLPVTRAGHSRGMPSGMRTEPSSPQHPSFPQPQLRRDPSIGRDKEKERGLVKKKSPWKTKREDERGAAGSSSVPPLPPPKDEITLDTNLDEMEGIVDQSVLSVNNQSSSPDGINFDGASSHKDSKARSLSDRSFSNSTTYVGSGSYQSHLPPVQFSEFRDPFTPLASSSTYTLNGTTHRAPPRTSSLRGRPDPDASISPTTILNGDGAAASSSEPNGTPRPLPQQPSFTYVQDSPRPSGEDIKGKGKSTEGTNKDWEIPESWGFVPADKDPHHLPEDEAYSSSDDSLGGTNFGGRIRFSNPSQDQDQDSLTTPEDELSERAAYDEFGVGINGRFNTGSSLTSHTNGSTLSGMSSYMNGSMASSTFSSFMNGSMASIDTIQTVQSGSTGHGSKRTKLGLFKEKKPSGKNSIPSSSSSDHYHHPRYPTMSLHSLHSSHAPVSYPHSQLQPPPPHSFALSSSDRRRRSSTNTGKKYAMRVYTAKDTYHVMSANFTARAQELLPMLNTKLLPQELEKADSFHLYLQDRGRERVVAPNERPADLMRRRLEQAGYEVSDGLELGGEGLSFLLKFVYKSKLLTPSQNIHLENYETVDLSKRHLRTIPPILHQHATEIVTLNLSRNHNLELPADFMDACTGLTELRLSEMAYKRVPNSILRCSTLNRLDISGNRLSELEQPYLDSLPELRTLYVQNNRLEKLPWHVPKWALTNFNISNNKFKVLPSVVCELENLRDLDISFNMITELPEEIEKLKKLEHLIVTGNRLTSIPSQCAGLESLRRLDCRRNNIGDLGAIGMLNKLEKISADWNALHEVNLSVGPYVTTIDATHNEITQLSLVPGPIGHTQYSLSSLDVSHARLSSLDDRLVEQLTSLKHLKLDYNQFKVLPESLKSLTQLETLSIADNHLSHLPEKIGDLQSLVLLDVHNNNLRELPQDLWNCGKLKKINATSNFLENWQYQPSNDARIEQVPERKPSASSLGHKPPSYSSPLPPLARSLEKLYLGENKFTDDFLMPLTILKEIRVLNLSFNDIQELPPTFFYSLTNLEELYLSGNKLTSIPIPTEEDAPVRKKLNTLFLNGNRFQTLPAELQKILSLTVLDVGSNLLKYNINNWEFDWNWNFNKALKYLNLSGNKRLTIKSDRQSRTVSHIQPASQKPQIPQDSSYSQSSTSQNSSIPNLAAFTSLGQLRVLGLMDVTITPTSVGMDLPDENEERRVRTSESTVLGMAYGIADTLGKNEQLNMLDLATVLPGRDNEAVFAMFGRAQPPKAMAHISGNKIAKFLRDKFVEVFMSQLQAQGAQEGSGVSVTDALRRSFLKLNQNLHDNLFQTTRKASITSNGHANQHNSVANRGGASGIVLYFEERKLKERKLYVANTGNALAVVCRGGSAQPVSKKHDPYDKDEIARIRSCEGWISPEGLVNNELDISRSFGFFHLMPIVNARPEVREWTLTDSDEFVIVGNRGLWDYVSPQTAVDIARQERADPMIAAQKLRDFALSYGAEGSTMIMVISVSDLSDHMSRLIPRPLKDKTIDKDLRRLDLEVSPPKGHIALVFTDIRNSTHLWEVNRGMPAAWRLHNSLLRRHLRGCGGYEVKTEGDAFMCAFPTTLAAVWWAMVVQVELVKQSWPLEILECEDGKPIRDAEGRIIAQGLSVRMGIHCGRPLCEQDPVNHRMDYFGPVVNRSARIEGKAAGGQIMCSAEVMKEIDAKVLNTVQPPEYPDIQAIEGIRQMEIQCVYVGEVQLKGLELPDHLTLIYPLELAGRHDIQETVSNPTSNTSRIQFDVKQLRQLGLICLRLEALASSRVFLEMSADRKSSARTAVNGDEEDETPPLQLYGNPDFLLPALTENSPEKDFMVVLDTVSGRIENAVARIREVMAIHKSKRTLLEALKVENKFDERTLESILSILESV
ncbi:cysteinyl-tRNA synthetase [Marasmius sp. AFHP31]|nr:cysteinyl-tRNA synthetase [Marasmius sp. AFHP31]